MRSKPKVVSTVARIVPRPKPGPVQRPSPPFAPVPSRTAKPKVVTPENLNPFDFAIIQFDRAADKLGLDAGVRQVLSTPKRQLIVSVPVKMDDGTIRVFDGYRVQHSIARGPSKAASGITRASRWTR